MDDDEGALWSALDGILTPRAIRVLQAADARFDLGSRCGSAELQDLMAQHGATATDPILEAEQAFGGLQFDGDDPYRLGVYSMLGAPERRAPWQVSCDVILAPGGNARLHPFALGGGADARHWIGPDGAVWFQELMCMQRPIPQAESARIFVERIARTCDPITRRLPFGLRVWAHLGAALAAALGVPHVPEASDAIERVWEDEDHQLTETPDWQFLIDPLDPEQEAPEPIMEVRTRSEAARSEAVRIVRAARPEVKLEVLA